MLEDEKLKDQLQKVSKKVNDHFKKLDKEGARFNIFSILNLSANEAKLHSKFLGALFDINGMHGYGNIFFENFVNKLRSCPKLKGNRVLEIFDCNNYKVEIEKNTGIISGDNKSGGRIDILITDYKQNKIIIENKIYARDQNFQLLRYFNYDKNALLLYLTLNGNSPSEYSTNREIEENVNFYCISYRNLISEWLEESLKHSKDRSRIYQSIRQYLDTIKQLTGQNFNFEMNEDLVKILVSDVNFFDSVELLSNAKEQYLKNVRNEFWKQITEKKKDFRFRTHAGYDLDIVIEEDEDGFYYGFNLKNGEIIDSSSDQYLKLKDVFLALGWHHNHNYVGWMYSRKFNYFSNIESKKLIEFYKQEKLERFVQEVFEDIKIAINEINDMGFGIKEIKQSC